MIFDILLYSDIPFNYISNDTFICFLILLELDEKREIEFTVSQVLSYRI